MNSGIIIILGGAGFCPSTVCQLHHLPVGSQVPAKRSCWRLDGGSAPKMGLFMAHRAHSPDRSLVVVWLVGWLVGWRIKLSWMNL